MQRGRSFRSLEFGFLGNLIFLGGSVRTRTNVEARIIGGCGRIVVLFLHVDSHAVGVEHFDIQGQGLHFLKQHLEGLGMPAGGRFSPFTMAP